MAPFKLFVTGRIGERPSKEVRMLATVRPHRVELSHIAVFKIFVGTKTFSIR